MFGSLLPILISVLPDLAGAVAKGKAGDVIAAGAKVAKDLFGSDDPAKVAEAIKTPEQAEAFKARLAAETADLQARLADIQDARAMTVELAQAGSPIAWGATIISVIVTLAFAGMTWVMLFKTVPDSQANLMVFGTLSTAFGMVLNYWLGSSAGSKDKDSTITAAIQTIARKAVR